MSADRWLVLGLGNPEAAYGGTRHNVGAAALEHTADRHGVPWSSNKRVRCRLADLRVDGQRLTLALPVGYMNELGGPAQAAASWFDVPPGRLVVVHDDLDLPLATMRLKRGGGHGGHNGLRDLDRALDSRDYLRIRIGIGRPPGRISPRDHVLGRWSAEERDTLQPVLDDVGDALKLLVNDGLEPAQNRFHSRSSQ